MKKIYIYLLFVVIGISPIYSQTTLTQANEAYGQEDYIKAIELYEQTLREQGVSSDLYYNLGNAYYKHNEFAKAILNYERALLLNPGNEDARFNLEMANTHIVDKIDPVGKFFLSVWIDSLRNFLSSNTWAVIGIVSFLLFIGGLYLYLFSKSVKAKKFGFFGGIILFLIAVLANWFAWGLDADEMTRDVLSVFGEACDNFDEMRTREGAKLAEDVRNRASEIERMVGEVEVRSPERVREYREKLLARMKEVLADTSIDETRIVTEAAIYADKTAVDEETVRLRSHLQQLDGMLNEVKPVGRKLDFLVQEMNRETNTIGSKANDVSMAQIVVNIKSEIEKIREQIQNIE